MAQYNIEARQTAIRGPVRGGVYTLPKHLDEEVAQLHLKKIGAKPTTLTHKPADEVGVPVEALRTPETWR